MNDQCKHCLSRGKYRICTETFCSQHDSWIAKKRIARIQELEDTLQLIADLPAHRQNECENYALNILAQLPPQID